MEVEMKIRGLMMDPVTNMPIVVLKDWQRHRAADLGWRLRGQRHRAGDRKGRDARAHDPRSDQERADRAWIPMSTRSSSPNCAKIRSSP